MGSMSVYDLIFFAAMGVLWSAIAIEIVRAYIRFGRPTPVADFWSQFVTDLTTLHQAIVGAQTDYQASKVAHQKALAMSADKLIVLNKAQTDFDAAISTARADITPDPDSVWGKQGH